MKTPIIILLHTTQYWQCKLGNEYKDIYKDLFVDGHEL